MSLIFKILFSFIGIACCTTPLAYFTMSLGVPSVVSTMIWTSIGIITGIIVIYLKLILPISKLYDALHIIDFEKDIIDFSKLDTMKVSGYREIKEIQEKFKYLLDVLTERINRVNSQTYKSEHDALTGCYNRTRLELVKSGYEAAKSVGIVFIDVNNLKRMNDVFGHEAGDALLRAASNKLQFWRSYGDVYRLGGDEFMIVLRNKSKDYIQKLIDQWYPTVGQLNRDYDGFKCVLSYGFAYALKGRKFDDLQKEAD